MGEAELPFILEEYEHAKHVVRTSTQSFPVLECSLTLTTSRLRIQRGYAKMVMRAAMAEAGLKPEDVDYINVHGTSTPVGDISEVKAIREVLGDHAYRLNISSTKSMTGHSLVPLVP